MAELVQCLLLAIFLTHYHDRAVLTLLFLDYHLIEDQAWPSYLRTDSQDFCAKSSASLQNVWPPRPAPVTLEVRDTCLCLTARISLIRHTQALPSLPDTFVSLSQQIWGYWESPPRPLLQ